MGIKVGYGSVPGVYLPGDIKIVNDVVDKIEESPAYLSLVGGWDPAAEKEKIEKAYAQAYDNAAAVRDKAALDAENAYAMNMGMYGRQAEALKAGGYSTGAGGGYSTFLSAQNARTRQSAKDAAHAAYMDTVANLKVKEQSALSEVDSAQNTYRSQVGQAAIGAYESILNGIQDGKYDGVGVNNAIAAYESLYGKMDDENKNNLQQVYDTYAKDYGVIGADVNEVIGNTTLLTNWENAIASNMATSMDKETIVDAFDEISKLPDGLEKETLMTKHRDAFKTNLTSAIKDSDGKPSDKNIADFLEMAKQIDEKNGNTKYADAVKDAIRNASQYSNSGKGLAYLGKPDVISGSPWEAFNPSNNQAANTDNVKLAFGDDRYTIKVNLNEKPDTNTQTVLNFLFADKVSDYDFAVAYEGKIYFYNPKKGWLTTTEGSSEAELNDLDGMEYGFSKDDED